MYCAIKCIAILQIDYVINTLPRVLHFGFQIQGNRNARNVVTKNPSGKIIKFRKLIIGVKDEILFRIA